MTPLPGRQTLFAAPFRDGNVNSLDWIERLRPSLENNSINDFDEMGLRELVLSILKSPGVGIQLTRNRRPIYLDRLPTQAPKAFPDPSTELLISIKKALEDKSLFGEIIKSLTAPSPGVFSHIGSAVAALDLSLNLPA